MLIRIRYRKFLIASLLLLCTSIGFSQSKAEVDDVLAKTAVLHKLVFGIKDSVTLEKLFAQGATYGHSSGKVQTRTEAIAGIVSNKSTYTDSSVRSYSVSFGGNAAVVRYNMRETETKSDGKSSPLNIGLMLVWIKEKGDWKLFGRQAFKLPD